MSDPRRGLVWMAVVALAHQTTAGPQFAYKMISGEASEFTQHRVPLPSDTAVHGLHTTYLVEFAHTAGDMGLWSQKVMVDSKLGLTIAFFTTLSGASVGLTDPSGKAVDLASHEVNVTFPEGDSGSSGNGVQWQFQTPVMLGEYTLVVTMASAKVAEFRHRRATAPCDGVVMVWNEAPETDLLSHPTTLNSILGHQIGLSARVFDSVAHPFAEFVRTKVKPPAKLVGAGGIVKAELIITSPSGVQSVVPMTDTGVGVDETADDGEYAGAIEATEVGPYRMEAMVSGVSSEGAQYTRSAEHTVIVDDPQLVLTDKIYSIVDRKTNRLSIYLMAKPTSSAAKAFVFKPYMEVWGQDTTGASVPIAFSQNLARMENFLVWDFLRLELDLQWIAKAKVGTLNGLTAQNIYVQNANDQVVLAIDGSTPITVINDLSEIEAGVTASSSAAIATADALLARVAATYNGEITRVMRDGIPPRRNSTAPRVDGKVLLVHGYCADKNPFEVQASDWTDAVFYDGTKLGHAKSRSNNQFTEDLVTFIESQNLGTFSAVGQSQGGLVILNMLNYFHTGLDEITTGRKIQSIASPYLGNTALTNLGDLAGVLYPECDPPADMGRAGATAWMAGITQSNIDQTNIYRTKYSPGGLFGKGWCNMLMNTLLEGDNDGVVETVFSTPPSGGNVFPITEGWCHMEGMNHPPSFWDTDRNKEMSAAAGRK